MPSTADRVGRVLAEGVLAEGPLPEPALCGLGPASPGSSPLWRTSRKRLGAPTPARWGARGNRARAAPGGPHRSPEAGGGGCGMPMTLSFGRPRQRVSAVPPLHPSIPSSPLAAPFCTLFPPLPPLLPL